MGVFFDTDVVQDIMGVVFYDMVLMCLYKDEMVVIRNKIYQCLR